MNAKSKDEKLLARMHAVRGIAKRAGYPDYKAEDIAHDVAVSALEGRDMEKQANYFSFVDALRGGSEGTYTRAGKFTQPVYESQFEDYADIVNGLRTEFDFGSLAQNRSDIFDLVSALSEIPSNRIRPVILLFYYGWTMDEISKCAGVTESRISQLVTDALKQIKKKVISTRLSQEEQGERKQQEFRKLLQKETGLNMGREEKSQVARVFSINGLGMVSFEIEKIPEELCEPFAIAAF